MRYWEGEGYISINSMVGEIGGKQYHYQVTDKLNIQLEEIILILLKNKESKETSVYK